VVPTFHDVKIGKSLKFLQDRPQFVRRAERVTRPLNEQHRNCDIRQMLHAKQVQLARRMERIAEEDEAVYVGAGGHNLGGDSPAQGFAANYQRTTADLVLPNCLDDSPKTRLERIVRIRNAPALLRIEKIERDDVHSARCEPGGKSRHEITSLTGASSVPKNQRDIGVVALAAG
jgi:hypothetical protein